MSTSADSVLTLAGQTVLCWADDGEVLARPAQIMDFIGAGFGAAAGWLALPVSRLSPEFFQLRSGLAGEVAQKFVNYQIRLAVVGDIQPWVKQSEALSAWVRECNRGQQVWFVRDLDELALRLGAPR